MEDCLYDERNALLDDLQLDMLEQTHQEAMQFTSSLLEHDDDDDDDDVSVQIIQVSPHNSPSLTSLYTQIHSRHLKQSINK